MEMCIEFRYPLVWSFSCLSVSRLASGITAFLVLLEDIVGGDSQDSVEGFHNDDVFGALFLLCFFSLFFFLMLSYFTLYSSLHV